MPDGRERVTYISSHTKQENLYAVYETTDCHYWTELANSSFKKVVRRESALRRGNLSLPCWNHSLTFMSRKSCCSYSQTVLRKSIVWNAYRRCTITNERQITICRHSGKEHSGDQKVYPESAQKGILIYRTLLETESIQQTAVKTKEPADKVKKIAE